MKLKHFLEDSCRWQRNHYPVWKLLGRHSHKAHECFVIFQIKSLVTSKLESLEEAPSSPR